MGDVEGTAVGVLCVISPHGVPLLVRAVGRAPPPRTELMGILNAIYHSVHVALPPRDDPAAPPEPAGAAPEPQAADFDRILVLDQIRTPGTRVSYRALSPSGGHLDDALVLVLISNDGATHGAAAGAARVLNVVAELMLLLEGRKALRAAVVSHNDQALIRKLRVRRCPRATALQARLRAARIYVAVLRACRSAVDGTTARQSDRRGAPLALARQRPGRRLHAAKRRRHAAVCHAWHVHGHVDRARCPSRRGGAA